MALMQIPISNGDANFSEKVELNGVTYLLRFRWNDRLTQYTMDVCRADGTVIAAGLPLESGWFTTARFIGRVAGLPDGLFLPNDNQGTGLSPTIENFGKAVSLLYIEAVQ